MSMIREFEAQYQAELNFLKEKGMLVGEWSNVYDHCFTEGLVADVLATMLQLSKEEHELLVKAALLHDWYKRNEREAANTLGAAQYDIKAHESAKLLRDAGYPDIIVELTESVGHTSLTSILNSQIFLHRLMHYIDDITYGKKVVGLDERISALESAERYKELNESGRAIFGGKTYFEVQREVGYSIEKEISEKLQVSQSEVISLVQKNLSEVFGVTSL